MSHLEDRLFSPGPKKVLSLDGGGVRGVVALAFLEKFEELINVGNDNERMALKDYFHFIGGTSTGAIIATGLSLGFSIKEMIDIYLELSHRAFIKPRWHGGILAPKFRGCILHGIIREKIGHITLGSDRLQTGLAIVAKRIDTESPWIFHNSPRSKYYNPPAEDPSAIGNANMELVDILRASTAAPTYFEPEEIEVAQGLNGLFIDGGVSPFNNPALLLLMMVSSKAYGYGWPTGRDNLSILSVGTGAIYRQHRQAGFLRLPSSMQAIRSLGSLIRDNMVFNQALMQWLGHSLQPWEIDSEAGTLNDENPTSTPLCHYERFNVVLESGWLKKELGISVSDKKALALQAMDRPQLAEELLDIARIAAEKEVTPERIG